MNIIKMIFYERISSTRPLPPFKNDLDLIIHINKKIITKILRGSKFICTLYYVPAVYKKLMQLLSCPLRIPPSIFLFAHIDHFLSSSNFRNLLLFKMNSLSSVYLEINFPAVPIVKINNLSQQNLSTPRPTLYWSSSYYMAHSSRCLFYSTKM